MSSCDLERGPHWLAGVITSLLVLALAFGAFAGLLRLMVWLAPWRGL